MTYDLDLTIAVGRSRLSTDWRNVNLRLSALVERLKEPKRGTETLAEYLALPKDRQDRLKDIGGFVGGELSGPRRTPANVMNRSIIALDLDNIPAGADDAVLNGIDMLGCGYVVYSTRKHRAEAPRLRVLIPLNRPASPDEYEPIARRLAQYIGITFADPTTYELNRLMYWPSCCADSEYVFRVGDKPFASTDGLLATYEDWRDVGSWPTDPDHEIQKRPETRQQDPESKTGTVGVFCREYDIYRAMDELIPGVYEPVDNSPDRYTYTGGSTTGGVKIYEDGKYLYSHHATDPCSGRLVNAFDLVRLHLFGDRDADAKPNTPAHKLPSYAAMCAYADSLPGIASRRAEEEFGGIMTAGTETPAEGENSGGNTPLTEWAKDLSRTPEGKLQKTVGNVSLLIANLPMLKGRVRLNLFDGRITASALPWRAEEGFWVDADTTELRVFFERQLTDQNKKALYIPAKQDVNDAVVADARKNAFHPVRDYLNALPQWDGVPRLDQLYIDYLGAADNVYTRTVARKALCSAISRVMEPGCKYDYMTVFVGDQGRGKSSFIRLLVPVQEWFTDSLVTFDGQKAFEAVLGKWLVEVPEMHAFDKATMNQAKAFISKQDDFFRAAYDRFPDDHPRQCIFFGTTNNYDCLRDETGNRRFWPIDIDTQTRNKDVFRDLPLERDQIWAEALARWHAHEDGYLPEDIEKMAKAVQEAHREAHPWEDVIRDFVEAKIPADWDEWDIDLRRTFWGNGAQGCDNLVERTKVCAQEVAAEVLGISVGNLDRGRSRTINSILDHLEGWERAPYIQRYGKPYGGQRGYVKMKKSSG